MRNLQKILALALALIMSFSLVVTANAAFSDEADINETYNESVSVLAQLEVFRGYTDGSYKPQDSITRAEVAAIIYRIATGDVNDTQVSLYSDWNRFSDVQSGSWYAGYVNYCANAEYIKGYEDGSFRPNNNVTGYEALAMILRAVGYGKMDEFTGSNWAVQTAARANTLKVSRNVTAALLGSAASREVVAELLFRSILVPTVTYNNAFGYQETDTTLGYESFKLESIEGVVVANEYANLYDTEVLDDGKTDLEVEGVVRHLDITSALTDVGESRYAYVSGSKVYALEDTGNNTVFETGEGKTIDTDSKFRSVSGLTKNDDTEFYVDFGREGHFSSDYRLEISITFEPTKNIAENRNAAEVEKWFEKEYLDDTTVAEALGVKVDTSVANKRTYHKIIRAEEEISQDELDVIHGIFACADDNDGGDTTNAYLGVQGDVYAGTRSAESSSTANNRYVDLSDDISYRTFVRDYINSEAYDISFGKTGNGEWLKIVDNDGDGVAEYAFKTQYYLDEAISSYTKSGNTILEFEDLDVDDYDDGKVVYLDDGIDVGSVVIYSVIDNKVLVELADMVTDIVNTVSFRNETITTDGGETYSESDITNYTDMDQVITNMDEKVEYNMYFDKYGYVRAYELAQGNRYALLTELYWTRGSNTQYVTNADLIAEVKAGDAKIDEYTVINDKDNDFDMGAAAGRYNNWGSVPAAQGDHAAIEQSGDHRIVLQPATAHLAVDNRESGKNFFNSALTNVAKYVLSEDGVRLTTAAEYATDNEGKQWYYTNASHGAKTQTATNWPVYAVDYIRLDATKSVAEDARRYDVDDEYYENNNVYVNAVHDTEYYIVNQEGSAIRYFTDYTNVPAIDAEDINAAYAVARNTESNNNKVDYWVADVIVIEVGDNWVNSYDSISLVFDHMSQTSGRVVYLDTLNNESAQPPLTVIPDEYSWGRWSSSSYGFWRLNETAMDGDELKADDIDPITSNYNGYGIYAGYVTRLDRVNRDGGYLMVMYNGAEIDVDVAPTYGIDDDEAVRLTLSSTEKNSDVKTGDYIIWVENEDGDVAFIVDVTDSKYENGDDRDYDTPAWLWDQVLDANDTVARDSLLDDILADQIVNPADAPVVTFYGVKDGSAGDNAPASGAITVSYRQAKYWTGEALELQNVTTSKINAEISLSTGSVTYTLSLYGNDGKLYSYTLTQSAANNEPAMENDDDLVLPATDEDWSIKDFVEYHAPVDPNATALYRFTTHSNKTFEVTYENGEFNYDGVPDNTTTGEVKYVVINVTAENEENGSQYLVKRDNDNDTIDWTSRWTEVVESLTWNLPAVLDQTGPTLLSLVGEEVNAGYAAIDAAVGQDAENAACLEAIDNLRAAVKREIDAYVERLLGGKNPTSGLFNYSCDTIVTRYAAYQTAWSGDNWTLAGIQEDTGSVKAAIESIIVHLDSIYRSSSDGNSWYPGHGEP